MGFYKRREITVPRPKIVWLLGELSSCVEVDLSRIQPVVIAKELSMATWREFLRSLGSDLPSWFMRSEEYLSKPIQLSSARVVVTGSGVGIGLRRN